MTYDPIAHGCQCSKCPLQGQQVIAPEGNPRARIAIVSDSPDLAALKQSKMWIGPAGAKLNELLYKAGLNRSQVWFTSLLLCQPVVPEKEGRRRFDLKEYAAWLRRENVIRRRFNKACAKTGNTLRPELTSPFECCAPRLVAELAALDAGARATGAPNGVVVVPLGSFSLGALTTKPGAQQSILKYRGSVFSEAKLP